MSPTAVDRLNIGLMIGSLLVAIVLPFELLLFSWAVLGPLHYLTEISWLHDRQYFTKRPGDRWLLLGALALITLGTPTVMKSLSVDALVPWNPELIFLAFGLAAVFGFVASIPWRIFWVAAIGFVAYAIHGSLPSIWIFSLYLPTLIHVFVFTGCFLAAGALRSGSSVGKASLAVFVVCAAIAVLSSSISLPIPIRDSTMANFHFDSIVAILTHHFGLVDPPFGMIRHAYFPLADRDAVFSHPAAIAVARFVAFAYTYHYLNWFSKTSIIGWHEIPRARGILIVVLWLASVALYYVDFAAGLTVLFVLSFAHVILEFPLDHKVIATLTAPSNWLKPR